MSGARWDPAGVKESKPRSGRLSRSFRQTQVAAPPQSPQTDFKTPTRVHRSRPAAPGESPQNDSDFQQDIIWDPASPSPHRLTGRRRKKLAAVNISEIVSRIAPKHGRPRAAEPTLQQWIGDSASIPCTPDLQAPRPKKKSPRLNGVDDLLKLAKRFDFNLFHQDEQDEQRRSPELLSCETSVQAEARPASRRSQPADGGLDPNMNDDLDFLFDGPTQNISRNLSQASSAQSSQVKPTLMAAEDCGKPRVSLCPPVEFEDDWANDDLLNDSLVFEMTQNPLNFTVPKFCSTQRPTNQLRDHQTVSAASSQSGGSTVGKENVQPGMMFRLEQTANQSASSGGHQPPAQSASSGEHQRPALSASSGGHRTAPQDLQRTSAQSFSKTSDLGPSVRDAAPNADFLDEDFLDEDLDSFFSSEPVWDDPADDDLLCEMCEDLEKQMQASNQRAALQPVKQAAAPVDSGRPGPGPGSSSVSVSLRVTQTVAGSVVRPACLRGSSEAQSKDQYTFKKPSSPVSMATKHPATTATNSAVGKCSAAEIELKKQQAMERRRRRLQAAQSLPAPP